MRKFLAGVMTCGLLAVSAALPAFAEDVTISDVAQDYWARNEIVSVVSNNVMTLADGKFNPEDTVKRADFVSALLIVLGNDKMNVTVGNKYSDVRSSDVFYKDILRSDQLGLVYGYPNGTFKPKQDMLRSEAQSVMGHIIDKEVTDYSILEQYGDYVDIPGWAKYSYAKTLTYGIFVNYPDENELRPNDELTRAEAAVLLARLNEKLGVVQKRFLGPEKVIAVEHLDQSRKATNDEVKVTNYKNIVMAGNALKLAFDEKFLSEDHQVGDVVYFVAPEDICTEEGTLVVPANTKFYAQITDIKEPQWFNKNARVYLQLTQIILPNGETAPFVAKPATKDNSLHEGPWMTTGKLVLCTVTGGVIGGGIGTGIAFIPDPVKVGTGIAIGTPVGAAVGLITGLVTPGLEYHAKQGEEVVVILCEDANIKRQ